MSAPFGRRLCEVATHQVSGGYRIFSLIDREGPAPQPGQFYMLASERGWGEGGGRPYLPRAISVAETAPAKEGVRLDFLVEGVGPGESSEGDPLLNQAPAPDRQRGDADPAADEDRAGGVGVDLLRGREGIAEGTRHPDAFPGPQLAEPVGAGRRSRRRRSPRRRRQASRRGGR